jgi:hypothetical protein
MLHAGMSFVTASELTFDAMGFDWNTLRFCSTTAFQGWE